jgi:hypothetical protein
MGSLRSLNANKWFEGFDPEEPIMPQKMIDFIEADIEYVGSYYHSHRCNADLGYIPLLINYGLSHGYYVRVWADLHALYLRDSSVIIEIINKDENGKS